MRIIHDGGFGDDERRVWKNVIFHNLIDAFVDIFDIMKSQRTELQIPDNIVTIRPREKRNSS